MVNFKKFFNKKKIKYKNKIVNFLKLEIFKRIYFQKNYNEQKTILVVGTGRSGTTWLAETLSNFLGFRLIFEPFHQKITSKITKLKLTRYIPPDFENQSYYKIFKWILGGNIKNRWVDNNNRVFKSESRIIKSIRLNLTLKWIKTQFPEIPIILILRHPCGVVSSRKVLGWEGSRLDLILEDDKLIEKHLKDYLNIIKASNDLIQRNALVWCIETYIPLKIMKKNELIITTYEKLITNFDKELKRILSRILKPKNLNSNRNIKNFISVQANKNSAIIKENHPLEVWKHRLNQNEINKILNLVKEFSLDHIYDIQILPKTTNFINYSNFS